jgi:hypothetical protein
MSYYGGYGGPISRGGSSRYGDSDEYGDSNGYVDSSGYGNHGHNSRYGSNNGQSGRSGGEFGESGRSGSRYLGGSHSGGSWNTSESSSLGRSEQCRSRISTYELPPYRHHNRYNWPMEHMIARGHAPSRAYGGLEAFIAFRGRSDGDGGHGGASFHACYEDTIDGYDSDESDLFVFE